MNSISHRLPDLSAPLISNRAEQGNLRSTQFTNASFQETKSTALTLVTAEGDQVTFSSFSSVDAGHSIYTRQGLVDGLAIRTEFESFHVAEEFGFEMSVEGELNEQELNDIRAAFKTIEKVASDFFSGKTDHLMQHAEKISGLKSISRFEAVIQYERSASLQGTTTDLSYLPALTRPEEAVIPVNTLPAAKVSEQETLVDEMTETIIESNVSLKKAAKHSKHFLDQLFEKFEKLGNIDPGDLLLFRKIQSDFMTRLEENEFPDKSTSAETVPVSALK